MVRDSCKKRVMAVRDGQGHRLVEDDIARDVRDLFGGGNFERFFDS